MPASKTSADLFRITQLVEEEARTRLRVAQEGARIDRMMLWSFGGMAVALAGMGVAALTGLGGAIAVAPDMGGMAFVMGSVCLKDALKHWNDRQDSLDRVRIEQSVLGDDHGDGQQLIQNIDRLQSRPSMKTQIERRIKRNQNRMVGSMASVLGIVAAIPVALTGGIPAVMGAVVLGCGAVVATRTWRTAMTLSRTIRTQKEVLGSERGDRMSELLDRDDDHDARLSAPTARRALVQAIEQVHEARKLNSESKTVMERGGEGRNAGIDRRREPSERLSAGQPDGAAAPEANREPSAVAIGGSTPRRKLF